MGRERINRREFAALAGGAFAAWPLAASAQPTRKVHRLLALAPSNVPYGWMMDETLPELARLGYVEGRNLAVDRRNLAGNWDALPAVADEAVRLRPDIILSAGTQTALALKRATTSISIVFVLVADPVESGVVTNLARPSENVTGISLLSTELALKRLELLREAVPGISRLAVLLNPANQGSALILNGLRSVSRALRIELVAAEARSAGDFDSVFAQVARAGATGIVVLEDSIFTTGAKAIAELALKHRLPGVFGVGEYTRFGGLMSYAANSREIFRRAAHYVDKIFKGASPADLPVEQPTRFELVVNLKTARTLGLTIPQSILVRADEVIE